MGAVAVGWAAGAVAGCSGVPGPCCYCLRGCVITAAFNQSAQGIGVRVPPGVTWRGRAARMQHVACDGGGRRGRGDMLLMS